MNSHTPEPTQPTSRQVGPMQGPRETIGRMTWKFSFHTSFTRLSSGAVALLFLVTVVGRLVATGANVAACNTWPFCLPTTNSGWLEGLHLALAAVEGILIIVLLLEAWREQRDDALLLPLATVAAVLYFGQVLVGAVQVTRAYPLHLVVLHSLTSISIWIALGKERAFQSAFRSDDCATSLLWENH